MPAKSGSSEKKVCKAMNDLLSIYLRTMLTVRSKLITLALFQMSSSNTINTSLTWVSVVNNTYRVYLLFLCSHAFCKIYFSSPFRYYISREQQIGHGIEVDNHCTRLSLEEHTGTFLLSGKYFLYVCCSLAKTVSFYICDPVWFCLVLFGSVEFGKDLCQVAQWDSMQMSKQFHSFAQMFPNQPISSFIC